MSASPAGPPSGPASTTPNGGPAPPIRRRKPTGPFGAKPKPTQRRPPGQGAPPKPPAGARPGAQPGQTGTAPIVVPATERDDDPSTYTEFPLFTTKKALLEGLRHHVMRFVASKEPPEIVNPYDPSEDQFQRPLRLQRRFPHDSPKDPLPVNPEDDKEREKEAIRKAERQAEREANQAQIAPTDKTAAAKKRQPFKKKTEDVYHPQDTADSQKRAKLRYEEGRPWHLEDFTGKNSWVGTYEEPLSETHAMFVLEGSGFRMVPLEKWYRFAPTARYQTMNLDEAEFHMEKKVKMSRFLANAEKEAAEKKRRETERLEKLNRGRVGMRGEDKPIKGGDDGDVMKVEMANDVDEIDFEVDEEFQDDDEDKLFGAFGEDEQDAKDTERKLKEERHGANIFAGTGVKEDKDWFEEEEREKREAAEERKKAKKLRKNLIKREKKFEYDSESDHLYSDESDSEDSDEERLREEEERKKKEEEEAKANEEKLASGASSKGTNTPSSRPEKSADPLRNKASIANLKRPGSPNLSEASGSESVHKRIKKEHAHSRQMSPAGSLSPNAPRRAGSGSDTEASGTEQRPKKPRPAHGAPGSPANGTPAGSRAGTPSGGIPEMPTADEIRAALPPEGITVKNLIALFRARISRIPGGKPAFIQLVKPVVKAIPGSKGLVGPK